VPERTSVSERSLRQDETRFRALAEASPAAIFIAQNGRISYANPALAALTGFEPAELLGMDPLDLVHAADRAGAAARRDARVRDENWETHHEVRIQTRTGDECWIDLTTTQVVYESGAAVVGTGIDVTERKRLEQRMQQGQRLEAIGRLAGGVAHDFNNLLMVISGETESLLDRLPHESPLRTSVHEIARAADRAASLTQQLLAFGRRQVLIARPVDLNQVVLDLPALLGAQGAGISTHLTPDLPPVRVDRTRLEQALINLVSNARDAMGARGSLTIATDLVEVDVPMREGRPWLSGGTWVRLQVSDTGPGIAPDVLPHVFEPFFSTKGAGPATGLGLSTVYGIVKQSEGFVWIDSDPGAGARVTILLPPVQQPAAVPAGASAPAAVPGRVLLVEDENGVRHLLASILDRNGFAVSSAPSAEAALDMLGTASFDVLLTDVMLPGMSGPELARRVRRDFPGMRVLFMSGYADQDSRSGVPAGANFINKPFSGKELVTAVEAVLNGQPKS
jgi:two-component system cell cycle sensor histidine kinase/response regulator CckA